MEPTVTQSLYVKICRATLPDRPGTIAARLRAVADFVDELDRAFGFVGYDEVQADLRRDADTIEALDAS